LYCGQENKTLSKLNLRYNNIGDEGAKAIGAELAVIFFMYFLVLLTFVVVNGVITVCLCAILGEQVYHLSRLGWQ